MSADRAKRIEDDADVTYSAPSVDVETDLFTYNGAEVVTEESQFSLIEACANVAANGNILGGLNIELCQRDSLGVYDLFLPLLFNPELNYIFIVSLTNIDSANTQVTFAYDISVEDNGGFDRWRVRVYTFDAGAAADTSFCMRLRIL